MPEDIRKVIDRQKEDIDTLQEPSLPTIKGWVGRDMDGDLYFDSVKPNRCGCVWNSYGNQCPLPNSWFPDLHWEDEPIEVEFLIKRV